MVTDCYLLGIVICRNPCWEGFDTVETPAVEFSVRLPSGENYKEACSSWFKYYVILFILE